MIKSCLHSPLHKQVWAIATPMVFANLSVPLLGLVDTAVMGHLSEVQYLSGVAVGSMLISLLYWLAGFLRMSTTGATAQAHGKGDEAQQATLLLQGLLMAVVIGVGMIVARGPIWQVTQMLVAPSSDVAEQAQLYADIRLLAAPFSLMNLVILGWLIGLQRSTLVMRLMLLTNILNIVLDLWLVLGLGGKTAGAAWASAISDMLTCAIALPLCWRYCPSLQIVWRRYQKWAHWQYLKPLIALNRDIFLRSLALQLCLAFITARAARLGDHVVAANAVLMNFMLLISYGLDGIAYAAEAMVGEAKGAGNAERLKQVIKVNALWTYILAVGFCLVFFLAGDGFIDLLTDLPAVRDEAKSYLIYMWWLPVVGAGCYLLDGVFIGLTDAKAMRNSMITSALLVFFPVWWFNQQAGNHGLWLAFIAFLAARGLFLGLFLPRHLQHID